MTEDSGGSGETTPSGPGGLIVANADQPPASPADGPAGHAGMPDWPWPEPHPPATEPDAEDLRLCLVDVGARGGLQQKWHAHAGALRPVLFEPDPEEAARLRATHGPEFLIVDQALFNTAGAHPFYRTRNPLCASLRQPNDAFLSSYDIKGHFAVDEIVEVTCVRYDALYRANEVPLPDAIKVDVVGAEYEVLQGFGDTLRQCLGVETQAHMYPIYRGEKLLGDIIALLAGHGLVLRRIEALGQFDGDHVVVNGYFTQRRETVGRLSPARRWKFDLLTRVWELPPYSL